MPKLNWHKLNASMFPKATQDKIAKRATIVKALQAITAEIDTDIAGFAGRIQVPVMVATGETTRFGNAKYVADPSGAKEVLPRPGEVLIVGWKYGFAVASGSAKDAATAKTEAVLI